MKIRPPTTNRRSKVEPRLDRNQIVRAALDLLDTAGFDNLTMRNLAKRLGVKAASLYWHVHNKQDLLSLLADEICASMREPDRTLPWRRQLEELGHEYRRVLLTHRDAARVLAESGAPSGPHRLRLTEIQLRILLEAGFHRKDAAYAGFLLSDYVTMFVWDEMLHVNAEAEGGSENSASHIQSWIKSLSPHDYPSLIALADYLTTLDADERFRFGIEILENGLETRLRRQ